MTGTLIFVFLWISTIVGWVIFNLYNKNKKMELMVIRQGSFAYDMISLMKELDVTMEKIDGKVWTSADPELTSLFDSVKSIQARIKMYTESQ
jgi:hypothetical protein